MQLVWGVGPIDSARVEIYSRSNRLVFKAFSNFSDKEVSIVQPDVPVRVVLFGFGMDDIALVVFTRVWNNCSMSDIEITQPDFTIQTEKRVVVKAAFPEFVPFVSYYLFCSLLKLV